MNNRLNELLEMYQSSNNIKEFKYKPKGKLTKSALLNAKTYIERWDNVVTDWFFHTSKEQELIEIFKQDMEPTSELNEALKVLAKYNMTTLPLLIGRTKFMLWGANINLVTDLSPDMVIGACLDSEYGTLVPSASNKLSDSIVIFSTKSSTIAKPPKKPNKSHDGKMRLNIKYPKI